MPMYEESCTNCKHEWEWISIPYTDQSPSCPKCGAPGERRVSLSVGKVFQPFTTRNVLPGGEPVTIRGPGQLRQLENEHNVKMVDDPKAFAPRTRHPEPS